MDRSEAPPREDIEPTAGLDGYPYLHSARAELLARAGRLQDARAAFERALERTVNEGERRLLERKLSGLDAGASGPD